MSQRCSHKWIDLYPRPEKGHPRYAEAIVDRLFLQCRYDYLQCADCGCLGYVSCGSQRGGGHKIYTIAEGERAEELRAQAARWQAKYGQAVAA